MYYDKTCNKRKYLRRMAWGKKRADKESVFKHTYRFGLINHPSLFEGII